MRLLKAILTTFGTMMAGMYGGQKNKAVRRFGIPALAVSMDWKRGWPMLLLTPILIMGYGEDSHLMSWIGIEFLVRAIYALLLSLPFYFYGLFRGLIASVTLIAAYQIHAGTFGYAWWFGDFLIEDIIRFSALGLLIGFNLFFYRKTT